jgi:hypothetical protein
MRERFITGAPGERAMREVVLGKCERCRRRQAEWQAVNIPHVSQQPDLCDGCFYKLRAIVCQPRGEWGRKEIYAFMGRKETTIDHIRDALATA